LDDEEGGNVTAGEPADELVTGGETSACHDQQSHTPAHDVQPHEGLSVCAFIFGGDSLMTPKIQLILDLSRLSPASKVLKLETSCVCQTNVVNPTAEVREQPNNRMSFLEGAKTLHMQNVKSGSRAVLIKGVAWKT
jgi:hypothetical protein